VVEVQGNVSRTGRIVPTIIINPVEINGVTVTRITGHNYGYIQKTGIGKGAVIKVTLAGVFLFNFMK
jgi:DNA ligase (NAD+)